MATLDAALEKIFSARWTLDVHWQPTKAATWKKALGMWCYNVYRRCNTSFQGPSVVLFWKGVPSSLCSRSTGYSQSQWAPLYTNHITFWINRNDLKMLRGIDDHLISHFIPCEYHSRTRSRPPALDRRFWTCFQHHHLQLWYLAMSCAEVGRQAAFLVAQST